MINELETLLELKELHYRGYLTSEQYIEKTGEILDNYESDYNQNKIEPTKFSNELLMAKKYGFFDGYSMWRTDEFVIDYDTVRKEFYLRSITMSYSLGNTRFYASDYKKTWWLKEDKSE